MNVGEIMTTQVATIGRGDPSEAAFNVMRTQHIRHLVVMDGPEVIGILSDTDLGGDQWDEVRAGRSISQLLTPGPVTIGPDTSTEEAAGLMREHAIRCLPVMDAGKLVGIVTATALADLLDGA